MAARLSVPDVMSDNALDKKPFLWALGVLALLVLVWLVLQFMGSQRLYNTDLWQRWHPVTQRSAPQVATPVEVVDGRRISYAVVQTEKGLYFVTGTKYLPAASEAVTVQANDRWDLYLCRGSDGRCMTIHSFCADVTWATLRRDAEGRIEGCYAPALGRADAVAAPNEGAPTSAQPVAPVGSAASPAPTPDPLAGPMGRRKPIPPPVGMSHPVEWAWRMGLPRP